MARPVTLIGVQLEALLAGNLAYITRPLGALALCQPGDRLWIREPFHLLRQYNGISPTAAALTAARPTFLDELGGRDLDALDLGPQRYARTLLRKWHRQHLLIATIGRIALQSITLDQVRAEGFASLADYRAHWDRHTDMGPRSNRWQHNPTVVTLTFKHVRRPLPEGGR